MHPPTEGGTQARTPSFSGQTSSDADGAVLHPGDAPAEVGLKPTNIVRLNICPTDVDAFMAAAEGLVGVFAAEKVETLWTPLAAARFHDPAAMIAREATAVA